MANSNVSKLSATSLRVDVPGRTLVDKLELELEHGELVAVLGQNGSGKSLTLETLAGLRDPSAGQVRLGDTDINRTPRQQVAQQLALLPQAIEDIFPATVLDTALIGRHPHIHGLRWETREDVDIALQALAEVGLESLAARDILTLSGGERRRLAIAQILAQSPTIYLLDEPTNHLDPQHQIEAMQTFRTAADGGATVIASLHDANLAARYSDRCLLLFGDGRWKLDTTAAILTDSNLTELYATPIESVDWRGQPLFVAASR